MADLPVVTRSESPLSRGEWESFFDVEGRMRDEVEFREKVFRNGVEHDIRPEVWKFLLGYFDGALTHSQRAEYRSKRVSTFCAYGIHQDCAADLFQAEEFFRMKIQWEMISDHQIDHFTAFRERKSQIEKDVLRTDRSHPFYEGTDNTNLQTLTSVLMT